jgi:hypothetical protein
MALTLRLVKGYELTYTELDDNFIFLSSSYLTTSSFNNFISSSYSTGSFTGSFIGEFDGILLGTAATASYGNGNFNGLFSGSASGSFQGNGSGLTGVTGEWDGSLNGNAQITGSLVISGSNVTTTLVSNTTITGSLSISSTGSFNGPVILNLTAIPVATDNSTAAAAGVPVGGLFINGNVISVRTA